jgi:hypothetical protein
MSIEALSLIATIALAFIGYLLTHWSNVQTARREAQLELINKRIGEFYGPLYIATQTSRRSYATLLQKLKRRAVFADPTGPPTEKQLAEWRIWSKSVFMPTDEFIEKLIIEKAYLIQEEEMPECLLQFITHVSAYRAILYKWKDNDFTELASIIDYPRELDKYATDSYRELKAKQLRLIGKSKLTTAKK